LLKFSLKKLKGLSLAKRNGDIVDRVASLAKTNTRRLCEELATKQSTVASVFASPTSLFVFAKTKSDVGRSNPVS